MPVIQRQVIPRQRSTGGGSFEKILQALSVGSSLAGTIAQLTQIPHQRRLDEEAGNRADRQLDIAATNAATSQEQLALGQTQQQLVSDTDTMSMITALVAAGRSTLMNNPNITPEERMASLQAPYRLSDIANPQLQEAARAVIARRMQADPADISPDFMIGQSNQSIADLLDANVSNLTLKRLFELQSGDPSTMDSLTLSRLGTLFGLAPGQSISKFEIDNYFAETMKRELFRPEIRPDGSIHITGAIPNNPSAFVRTAAEAIGLELHTELVTTNPATGQVETKVVPISVMDQFMSYALTSPIRTGEQALADYNSLVSGMSQAMYMPRPVAEMIVNGDYESIPPQWQGPARELHKAKWTADSSYLANQPWYGVLEELTTVAERLTPPGEARLRYIEDGLRLAREQNPEWGIPEFDVGGHGIRPEILGGEGMGMFIDSYLRLREETGGGDILGPIQQSMVGSLTGSDPFAFMDTSFQLGGVNFMNNGGVLTPSNSADTYDVFARNFSANIETQAQQLAQVSPAEAEEWISDLSRLQFNNGGVVTPLVTPLTVEILKTQVAYYQQMYQNQQSSGGRAAPNFGQ